MENQMTKVTITQIPLLNSVVIRQADGHFFISTSDSFIIDREGLLALIYELVSIGFIPTKNLEWIINENKKNTGDSSIR